MALGYKTLTILAASAAGLLIAGPAAEAQSTKFPVEAGSWGGKVRTGPGSSFKQVAGLKEGDTVKILEDTGVKMNGFPWFKIEFGEGRTGYKWGGVLCSRKTAVKGTFRQCEGYVASEQPEPAKEEPAEETKVAAEDPPAEETKPANEPQAVEAEQTPAETEPADEPKAVTVVPDQAEEPEPKKEAEVAAADQAQAEPEQEAQAEPEQQAQDTAQMKWSYRQFKDDNNKGKTASTLTFSVPETDNVLFQGYCAAGFRDNVSVLRLSSETGDLEDARDVKILFSGNNKTHRFDGTVVKAADGEAISGARITVKNDDPLWESLQELSDIEYRVNVFEAVSVSLSGANEPIASFLADCTSYAGSFDEEPSETVAAADPPAVEKALSPKEAFESAKELDTLEAWEAYLKSYPDGFRSDLARAYVKRLKGESTATAAATTDAEPDEDQSRQIVVVEDTVNLGPGTASWRAFKYKPADGGTAPAAGVEANGLELVTYCSADKRISTILREKKQGVYPDFAGRIERGLKTIEENGSSLPLSFDNGGSHSVPATQVASTGEVAVGSSSKGFTPGSKYVRDLMSANQVTLSAPPFAASFQLKGSRRALCSMLKSCGVKAPECARYERPQTVNVDPGVQRRARPERRRRARCPRRYVWLEGECVHRRFVAEYCGPGYRRQGSRCVRRRYRAPSYDVCPPGFFYEFGRCVPF